MGGYKTGLEGEDTGSSYESEATLSWRRFHGKESSPLEAIRELGLPLT